MDETEYLIIETEIGSYTVEVREPDDPPEIFDGFRTKEQAEDWIKQQRQLKQAADMWDQTKHRRDADDD